MNYIIETEGTDGTIDYLTLEGNSIGLSIKDNKDKINEFYNNLKNSDPEHSDSAQGFNTLAAVSVEDVRLTREPKGKFVPVTSPPEGSNPSYGGSQMWWPDKSNEENRGCGPVSAANITQYLASKNSTKYGKLYPYSSTSYSNFFKHMNAMYTLINPGVLGEPSVLNFKSKVIYYGITKGVSLTGSTLSSTKSRDAYATFVKTGLNLDTPVACLNIQPFGYEYGKHWMTFTKYFRDSSDVRYIAVSSWGLRYSVNFDTWQSSTYWWGGGLVYFK